MNLITVDPDGLDFDWNWVAAEWDVHLEKISAEIEALQRRLCGNSETRRETHLAERSTAP